MYSVPPEVTKKEHYDRDRTVFIGPKAQKILEPWLKDIQPGEYVFSPARDKAILQQERRQARKTLLWPCHLKRLEEKRKAQPKRGKGDHYTPTSIRQAVKRLCKTVKVANWTSNRLWHSAGTRFRKKYGVEVARLFQGHRKLNTTEIYPEANQSKAQRAIGEIG